MDIEYVRNAVNEIVGKSGWLVLKYFGSAQETVTRLDFGGFCRMGDIVYSRQDARQRLDAGVGLAGVQGIPA